jgi:glycosyltransferase involved in cell wall biosynthesis
MPVKLHSANIPPVADMAARPLWSVMIPTFNCGRYLSDTLASVLRQAPAPDVMQIEVVDDHSLLDDPESVVQQTSGGRIGFFRQTANVGHIKNFETCLKRARGQLIHLLHGDDYVLDGFYATIERAFHAVPQLGAAFCRSMLINDGTREQSLTALLGDGPGVLTDAILHLAAEQHIMTPSIVVRRAVYEELGAFDQRLLGAEDWEMWVRIAAHFPIWFEPQALAVYRMHEDSKSARHIRTGERTHYIRMAIDIMSSQLPDNVAASITRRAKQTYARSAVDTAVQLLRKRDLAGAIAAMRQTLRLSRSPGIFLYAARRSARALLL